MDIVDHKTRSQMMSAITATNTRPEMLVRRKLHRAGYRYRLHDRKLPGTPDIVLPRYKAIIEVHGCFWHRHDCHLFKWPASQEEFWRKKLQRNFDRDVQNQKSLLEMGLRVLVVWECALKGKRKLEQKDLDIRLFSWIRGDELVGEIRGRQES